MYKRSDVMVKVMRMLTNLERTCVEDRRKKEEFDKPTRSGLTHRLSFTYWLDYNYSYYIKRFETLLDELQAEGIHAGLITSDDTYCTRLYIGYRKALYTITIEQVG